MSQLTPRDKTRLFDQIMALESSLGVAPLRNVDPSTLDPGDVDVVAVASMVVRRDGSTVLVRRAETPSEWAIPGGTVDSGEDLVETAVREVKEETGLDTEIDAVLRIGLAIDYGPEAFRHVNRERFGKESIDLLFVNVRSHEVGGQLDCSSDPSANILEVRSFDKIPFEEISHVYKVLFVQQGWFSASLDDYPAVEFQPPSR